jgi:hypothetical protein
VRSSSNWLMRSIAAGSWHSVVALPGSPRSPTR